MLLEHAFSKFAFKARNSQLFDSRYEFEIIADPHKSDKERPICPLLKLSKERRRIRDKKLDDPIYQRFAELSCWFQP